jgi:DNA-binding CsgD family transcriptional regulator
MIDAMVLRVPCPAFLGRSAELETVAAAWDAACAGRGGLVFVVGEAGIGKSRLVSEISATVAERDAVVLRGRAVPGSSTTAFRPLAEALAAAVPDGGLRGPELVPWLPALAAIVPAVGSAGVGAETTVPVQGEAVLRLLRTACASTGGLLVLEDLHWADPQTLAVVEHLSDNLERAPVLCVATVRSGQGSPGSDLVRRVAARRTAPVVRLERFSPAQVAAMVYSCTGGVDSAVLDRVVKLADGVPFLVEELLASPGLPDSFADTVESRLAGLPDSDRRMLVTAASFGRHFDWRLLCDATGLSEADVVEGLERAVAAQLLSLDGDEFEFRHALTAEAVFRSVIPPRRRAFASAALAALDAAYAEPPGELREVAAHVSERAGQPDRAGGLFLASGQDALDRGALHTAVAALERADALLPPGADQDLARERLVKALASAGRVDEALAVGHRVADRLPPVRAAGVRLRLAGAALTASRWQTADLQLNAARRLARVAGSSTLDAEIAVREAELALGTNHEAYAASRAQAALDLARRDSVADAECAALQLLGRCARRHSLEAAEDWFRQALAAAEAHDLPVWRLRALHEIGTIALLDRAEVAALLEAQASAEAVGAMATAAILDIEIAAGYVSAHDLEAATRHGRDAVRRGTELGLGLVVAYGWHHVAGAATLLGDLPTVETASAAALAAAHGNRDVAGLLAGACDVVALLVANDTESALAAAGRSAELLRGSQTAPPMHTRAAWPLLLAVHGRPEALAAVEELEGAGLAVSRAGRGGLTMARAVLTGRTDPDRAAQLAVEADEQLVFVPWWRHVVRRLAAAAAAVDGWAIPAQWLTEAEEWLHGHGFEALAEACHALRSGPSPTVPPRWARRGITPREADVLALVIEGCPNREIAERLCLSVRTVEKHVESLLRKTATSTRTQLARVAAT